jgi:ankyrin repeat protein
LVQSYYMMGDFENATAHGKLLDPTKLGNKSLLKDLTEEMIQEDMTPTLAAMGNHIAHLEKYLKNYEVDSIYKSESIGPGTPSLLHLAAMNGKVESVKFLISKGASINKTNLGWTPLHLSILMGHVDVAVALLQAGADPNICPTNLTPVQLAVVANRPEFVSILHRFKGRCTTPMPPVPTMGVSDDMVIDEKSGVQRMPALAGPPVFHAAAKGRTALLKTLLDTETWPVSQHNSEALDATLLHMAAGRGAAGTVCHAETVSALIALGADVNAETTGGYTPLHFAARTGDASSAEAIAALLKAGAKMDKESGLGETPFVCALSAGSPAGTQALIAAGVDIASVSEALKQPLLTWCVATNMPQLVAAVLQGMAEKFDKDGTDPAVAFPALVDAEGDGEVTALHWACLKGDFISAALLLRHGANPTKKGLINGVMLTPLECSREHKVGGILGASLEAMGRCEALVEAAKKQTKTTETN